MHDMQRRTGRGRKRQHFFERRDRVAATHVHVDRCADRAGDFEDFQDLGARRLRGVSDAEADSDRAARQPARQARLDLDELQRRRLLVCRRAAGKKRARVLQHGHADGNVADAGAVVDGRFSRSLAVPRVDVAGADLELQRSRHAVGRFPHVIGRRLPMLMEIDEAGRDDQPARVDRRAALKRASADGADDATADPNGSNGVRIGLRINDTSVSDHEIERT
jgi:hypothetical protein